MLHVINAVLPVFLLFGVGWGLKRWQIVPDAFWDGAERLGYYVLIPALLVTLTAKADLAALGVAPMAGAIVLTLLVMSATLTAAQLLIRHDGPSFTSLFQGVTRFNSFLGLGVAGALWGQPGLALAAVGTGVLPPVVNILCIAVMARWGDGGTGDIRRVLKTIVTNPFILSIALGFGLNITGIGLPPIIGDMAEILGRATIPMGLLIAGAGLRFMIPRHDMLTIALTCILRLGGMPLLAWAIGSAMGLTGLPLAILVLFNALPTALASYLLARQMGGNAPLMAQIIAVETALSLITLPLWLGVLGAEMLLAG